MSQESFLPPVLLAKQHTKTSGECLPIAAPREAVSVTSPNSTVVPSNLFTVSALPSAPPIPLFSLASTVVLYPRLTSSLTTARPMYPVPPATMTDTSSGLFVLKSALPASHLADLLCPATGRHAAVDVAELEVLGRAPAADPARRVDARDARTLERDLANIIVLAGILLPEWRLCWWLKTSPWRAILHLSGRLWTLTVGSAVAARSRTPRTLACWEAGLTGRRWAIQ